MASRYRALGNDKGCTSVRDGLQSYKLTGLLFSSTSSANILRSPC